MELGGEHGLTWLFGFGSTLAITSRSSTILPTLLYAWEDHSLNPSDRSPLAPTPPPRFRAANEGGSHPSFGVLGSALAPWTPSWRYGEVVSSTVLPRCRRVLEYLKRPLGVACSHCLSDFSFMEAKLPVDVHVGASHVEAEIDTKGQPQVTHVRSDTMEGWEREGGREQAYCTPRCGEHSHSIMRYFFFDCQRVSIEARERLSRFTLGIGEQSPDWYLVLST